MIKNWIKSYKIDQKSQKNVEKGKNLIKTRKKS